MPLTRRKPSDLGLKGGQCNFILDSSKPGEPWFVTYCAQGTRYTMKKDDDGRPVRKYDHLCPEHREWVNKNSEPDEDDC
jgi:hypothetical protein